MEYEGPHATYHARMGTHPAVSYPHLEQFPDTQIRMKYKYRVRSTETKSWKSGTMVVNDCPRHFLWLSDQAVLREAEHLAQYGKWSERVLVEKAYFTLFYGGTGLASKYMDSVDDFQTDLVGWEIMNRSSDHCQWEGIRCKNVTLTTAAPLKMRRQQEQQQQQQQQKQKPQHVRVVTDFAINGFSLEGTLPDDLYKLSYLTSLDLHGNKIQGTIPALWGEMRSLKRLNLKDNRLSGTLPSSLQKMTNLKALKLSSNRLQGTLSVDLFASWADGNAEHYADYYADDDDDDDDDRPTIKSSALMTLDLSHNRFTGSLPMEAIVYHTAHLVSINLSDNLFTGSLPSTLAVAAVKTDTNDSDADDDDDDDNDEYGAPSSLPAYAAAGYNEPTEVFGLKYLSTVNLSGNRLEGSLPRVWMEQLPRMATLDLSNNQLTGSLPLEPWKAKSLTKLNLVRACVCAGLMCFSVCLLIKYVCLIALCNASCVNRVSV
jgi:Leucine-rich repeat (LRR) protein